MLVRLSLLLIPLYCWILMGVIKAQMITQPPESTTAAIGTNATFSCHGIGRVLWRINGTQVVDASQVPVFASVQVFVPLPRDGFNELTVTASRVTNATLVIVCVVDPISGVGAPVTSDPVHLLVHTQIITQPPESTTAALGTNATFSCHGIGRVLWQINGTQVRDASQVPVFASVQVFVPLPRDGFNELTVTASRVTNATLVIVCAVDPISGMGASVTSDPVHLLVHGSGQTPPAHCVQTFRIEQDRMDIYIMPGVVNCFSCALDTIGSVNWQVDTDGDLVPVSLALDAEADGNFLVVAMPDNYVQPGTSGRRNVKCTSVVTGQPLEARLASPILRQPLFTSATVNEGELLRITCVIRNIPSITSFQVLDPNGVPVTTVLGVFRVSSVTRTYAGTYTCVVRSTRDNSTVSATSTVVIQYAPEITPINSTLNSFSPGQVLHLQCGYAGVPVPTVWWFHNNSLLANGSGGVSITGGAAGDNYTGIVIAGVGQMSGGVYTCWANNTLGPAAVNYTVQILKSVIVPPPRVPQVQALCSNVVWYSPTIFCEGIIGHDVRFYHPRLVTQNITRHVGANGTFYIIQEKDSLINKQEFYVQVRVIYSGGRGNWSEGISLGCDQDNPTSFPETPSVYFELNGVVYMNNSANVALSEVGEGENALLCKTNKENCCGASPNRFGEFYYPNGIKVPVAKQQQGFYRNRGEKVIRLNRRDGVTSPKGKYRCEIPDANGMMQNIYINLI